MKLVKAINQQLLVNILRLIFIFNLSLLTFNSFSQNAGVSINNTGGPPNSKALLDVDATGMNPKAGVLVPRMSTANGHIITGSIPESLLIYNTDTHCFEAYYNGGWVDFGCLSGCTFPAAPTAGINNPSATQIVWNWGDASSPVSYMWGTTASYSSATDIGTNTSYTQTGLNGNTSYSLYVWAFNVCENSSYTILTQISSACSGISPCIWNNSTSFIDSRDNQTYNQVQLDNQCWIAQNLNYGTYEDLPACCGFLQQSGYKYCQNISGSGSGNNNSSCPMGGLYEWTTAMNIPNTYSGNYATPTTISVAQETCNPCGSDGVHGICPDGWHIPTDAECTILTNYLSGSSMYYCGGVSSQIAASMASTSGWATGGTMACDVGYSQSTDNVSGFNAIPGGQSLSGVFYGASDYAIFWQATEHSSTGAYAMELNYNTAPEYQVWGNKWTGFSVRCVRD